MTDEHGLDRRDGQRGERKAWLKPEARSGWIGWIRSAGSPGAMSLRQAVMGKLANRKPKQQLPRSGHRSRGVGLTGCRSESAPAR